MSSQNAKIVFSTAVVGSMLLMPLPDPLSGVTNDIMPFAAKAADVYGLP